MRISSDLNTNASCLCFCLFQPQNILLTSAQPLGDIRIVDFGLSRQVDNKSEVREILGTPEYVGESVRFYLLLVFCFLSAASNEGQKEGTDQNWSFGLKYKTTLDLFKSMRVG